MSFSPGDVVGFYSDLADKHKFHLCVSVGGHYIFVNSEKARVYAGDFIIDNNDLPFLEGTNSGKSVLSCSMVFQLSDAELRRRGAKLKGKISHKLLVQLVEFIENSPVLDDETKDQIIDGLGDWL